MKAITPILSLVLFVMTAGLMSAAEVTAQADKSLHNLFEPLTLEQFPPNRTASGKPSHSYWQNETDYVISVRLDDENHRIEGSVSITYTNNSPDELSFLWILLEQNLFMEGSKGGRATPVEGGRFASTGFDGGYEIDRVRIEYGGEFYNPSYSITDTRMRVDLEQNLGSSGDSVRVHIDYAFNIPEFGADRMGRIKLRDGWVYTIAQWYPNMAVYDELNGWNTRPYLGAGEFYRNFGTIEYEITLPWDFIVGGSGTLLNPEEVLTKTQIERLERATEFDSTSFIVSPDEIGDPANRPVQEGELTWRYRMEQTRDVAWAASRGFIWDAARAEMPSGRVVTAMSLYPQESAGDLRWGRSTEYTRASIMHYSEMWYEYPWDTAINVAGIVGGMEYPGVSFCGYNRGGASLWGVTDHEFGHNWFPMIVGSNERKWFWMDEGLNTFIGHLSTLAFNDGEYAPWIRSMDQFVPTLLRNDIQPIMTHADRIQPQDLGFVSYFKPALGLLMLRNHILGEEVFDKAFRAYIERWAYKHPSPIDFFRTMNDVSGENLDWFWRGWFYENRNINLAVEEVEDITTRRGDYYGALITISSPGDLVMPVALRLVYDDGDTHDIRLPVEIWHRSRSWMFQHDDPRKIMRVIIDPDRLIADVNRSNNEWTRPENSAGSR